MKLSTLLVTGKKLEGGRGGPLFFMLPERGGLLKIRGGSHVIVLVVVHSTERHFIYALKTRNLVVMDYCIQHFSNLKIHNNKARLSVCGVCGRDHKFCVSCKGRVVVFLTADWGRVWKNYTW